MYQSALKTWLAASSGVTQPSGAQKQSTPVAATKTQKKGESASLQAAERIMKMSLTASKKSDKDTTLSHESLAHAVRPSHTFVVYNCMCQAQAPHCATILSLMIWISSFGSANECLLLPEKNTHHGHKSLACTSRHPQSSFTNVCP